MFWKLYNSLIISIGMFTKIPVPWGDFSKGTTGIMGAFPFVGVLIGMLWFTVALICQEFIPLALGTCIVAAFPFMITGFLHLDGFMDVCDAVMSQRPLEEKLRILKDPTTGAFSVCSVVVLFLLFVGACFEIMKSANVVMFLFIPILSRVCSAIGVLSIPPLPTSSLVSSFKRDANQREIAIVLAVGAVAGGAMLCLWTLRGAFTILAIVGTSVFASASCKKQLGGFSGDIAGYMLTISELAAVLSVALWR